MNNCVFTTLLIFALGSLGSVRGDEDVITGTKRVVLGAPLAVA